MLYERHERRMAKHTRQQHYTESAKLLRTNTAASAERAVIEQKGIREFRLNA